MSMTSRRLGLLVKVAEVRTDQAANELAKRQAQLHEQEQRLGELRNYIAEYRNRPIPSSATLIDNRERFIARLGEAERQQVQAVTQAEVAVAEYLQRWQAQRRSGETYTNLQDDAVSREQRVENNRAQLRLDDFAMRGFLAQRAAFGD